MKYASKNYIINTVYKTNILPLTSICNTSCIFCSHRQNPEGIEVFRIGQLGMEDFEEIAGFLSPDRKIIIGESATRLIEGEPLLHKHFIDIMEMLRNKYKKTAIQITTNALKLDATMLEKLEKLGNIELNISVNCIDPEKRKSILGLKHTDDIKSRLRMIKGRLKHTGSCVLIPEILTPADIEELIQLLENTGADAAKLYLPGYTRKAGKYSGIEKMYNDTCGLVKSFRKKYSIPIIVEPSLISDLNCRIEGIIKGTPAQDAGLEVDDIITAVNGETVHTRVEAFNRVFRLSNPLLTIRHADRVIDLRLTKKRNTSPGFVVLYDADADILSEIKAVVSRHNAKRVLFITSRLAFIVIKELFLQAGFEFAYDIAVAENTFFGGNIGCAGLLTLEDVADAIKSNKKMNGAPDLVLLPPVMLDDRKSDLLGKSLRDMEEQLGIPLDTI